MLNFLRKHSKNLCLLNIFIYWKAVVITAGSASWHIGYKPISFTSCKSVAHLLFIKRDPFIILSCQGHYWLCLSQYSMADHRANSEDKLSQWYCLMTSSVVWGFLELMMGGTLSLNWTVGWSIVSLLFSWTTSKITYSFIQLIYMQCKRGLSGVVDICSPPLSCKDGCHVMHLNYEI